MSAPQASLPLGGAKTLPTTQLIHGDCLEVMPTLPANSVQMVFADLPYGATENFWDTRINIKELWRLLFAVLINCGSIVATGSQPFTSILVSSNLSDFRYALVWQKTQATGHLRANCRPLSSHEDILLFSKGRCSANADMRMRYTPQMLHGSPYSRPFNKQKALNYSSSLAGGKSNKSGERHPGSVHVFARCAQKLHPTQKPVALLEWLIRTYTNEGDTVLDPTAGSGTTAVAALRTGRHSICIEKDATYFAVAQKRIAEERARLEAQA